MRYLKPHFYDQFVCTAGDCPDTCCAGWQIVIDEDSLERYGNEKSEFGKRLRNSIDWEEECFYQNNRRCAFLNDENLCDLYKELGPDSLCDTCRLYPRHTEEYEGLRELSLSLSCPEAARIILSCKEPVRFLEEETDEEDDFEELKEFVRKARFDRMGAFAYSEEEGTYAAQQYEDSIPQEVKQARLDELMDIQQGISAELSAAKIGLQMKVIIDRIEGDYYIGRTEFDSPEVDPEVLISVSGEELEIGQFYQAEVTDADDFDLYAKILNKYE